MSTDTVIPAPGLRPKRRKAKWLTALIATAVLGGMAYVITGVEDALDEGPQERPMACSEAMYAMGWVLPDHASDQQCTELSGLAGRTQSGTFRMPRAGARPWLASLSGERNKPGGAGSDSVVERKEGLALSILRPPGSLQADEVRVDISWEGDDTAVVTFETFDY